jgi:hypothetical protein
MPESSNGLRRLRLRASSLIRIVFSSLRILWSLRFLLWGVLLTWLTWLTGWLIRLIRIGLIRFPLRSRISHALIL